MATSYPGATASRSQLAQWMAARATAAGLPGQLPVMAGLTESNLTNTPGGDRDSTGFFQMRQGIWNKGKYAGYQQNPDVQMQWFIDQATAMRKQWNDQGKKLTPQNYGEFVADIERPAAQYRGRYQTQLKTANGLLGDEQIDSTPTSQVPVTGTALARAQSQGASGLLAGNLANARANLLSTLASNSNPYQPFNDTIAAMRGLFDARDAGTQGGTQATSPVPTQDPGASIEDILGGGNPTGSKATKLASRYIGTPYVWGGSQPGGFDCSGLIQYVYGKLGVSVPRTAAEQFHASTPVDDPQPGDLVFFKGYTKSATNPGHVGMYVGNGQFIQAPKTGDVVKVSKLSSRTGDFLGFRRPGGN